MAVSEQPDEKDAVVTTRVEWRVESDTTEDEFGTDEAGARQWLAEVQRKVRDGEPHWEPAVLMSRTVTVSESPWKPITSPERTGQWPC
jgi:hypothetical protein